MPLIWLIPFLLLSAAQSDVIRGEDFAAYIKNSDDFKPVRQDPELLEGSWDRWVLMPWKHQWGRPYGEDLAAAMKAAGFNGGVCEHAGRIGSDAPLHEANGFLWYLDHTAGKGDLHLRENSLSEAEKKKLRESPLRPRCLLDPSVRQRMMLERIKPAVAEAKGYETCAAYALDDEISWGFFTTPVRWDNSERTLADFRRWLEARYGSRAAVLEQWGDGTERFMARLATPDDFQDLYGKPLHEWNLSPWCDALSYMDSQLLNLVGDLVAYANTLDPERPCGFVGGQAPAAYGGYDYAKLVRKVQFLEAYDIGCTMEILRSFNPRGRMPLVQTGFLDPRTPQGRWFLWYCMVHGNRGVIQWAEDWWKEGMDMFQAGSTVRELERRSGKLIGARWVHDGVALYYSHPSIQVSWFMDCELHKRTWINRGSAMNNRLASTNGTFQAWTKLLEDNGIQYDFVSYADALVRGLDEKAYPVLILPRVMALSDQEAEEIRAYVDRGGVVIADHLTGLFDQHGRGRARPVLDGLFGMESRPHAGRTSLFNGAGLTELDPEKHHRASFIEAGTDIRARCKRAKGFVVVERDLPCFTEKATGRGWAVHLNVSVMEYAGLREGNRQAAEDYAAPVRAYLSRAGVAPRVSLEVKGERPARTEALYWSKGGRMYVAVIKNPNRLAGTPGGDSLGGITSKAAALTVRFDGPKKGILDERTGEELGDGERFEVTWRQDEAALLSYRL